MFVSFGDDLVDRQDRCAAVCPGGVETHFAIGDGRSAGSAAMQGAFMLPSYQQRLTLC